jgi:hypothetical protein
MSAINKLGTQVVLPDDREGTVVYNGLDGVGIKWGLHDPDPHEFDNTSGGVVRDVQVPDDWEWRPDAMLRDPYRLQDPDLEYVGEEFEIMRIGLTDYV